MSTDKQARQPPGAPESEGGRFAGGTRAETGTNLPTRLFNDLSAADDARRELAEWFAHPEAFRAAAIDQIADELATRAAVAERKHTVLLAELHPVDGDRRVLPGRIVGTPARDTRGHPRVRR